MRQQRVHTYRSGSCLELGEDRLLTQQGEASVEGGEAPGPCWPLGSSELGGGLVIHDMRSPRVCFNPVVRGH